MSERNYYCFCDDDCRFPTMTREQIFSAIADATGNTPTNVDDAFVTKLREMNRNGNLSFWIGTTAQYNAIVAAGDLVQDCLYITTDDDPLGEMAAEIDRINTAVAALEACSGVDLGTAPIKADVFRYDYFTATDADGNTLAVFDAVSKDTANNIVYAYGKYCKTVGVAPVDVSLLFIGNNGAYETPNTDVPYAKIYGHKYPREGA